MGSTSRKTRAAIASLFLIAAVAGAAAAFYACVPAGFEFQRALGFQVLGDGTILVTDGGGADFSDTGSKVFVIDRKGRRLWRDSAGLRFAHSAVRLSNGNVLVPDTNADRLVELGPSGTPVWSSAEWGNGTGLLSDGTRLDYPNHAVELSGGRWLVSGRYNDRVFETDRSGTVYWSFGGTRKQHAPRRLANGNTLIADSDGNRIIEVDPDGQVVWQYAEGLAWPRFAQRLANGDTLITDSNHHRVLQVTSEGQVVFEYGQGVLATPYQAEELPGGTIMIADAQHGRLLEIDREKRIVWRYERKSPFRRWLAMPTRLENGGAEDGTSGKPDSWIVCDLLGPDDAEWLRDEDARCEGSASFSIRAGSGQGLNRWWGQYVGTLKSGTVTLRARVRTRGVLQGAGISVTFVDARGGILGGANSGAVSGDTDWRELVIIAPSPRETAVLGVSLSLIGPGQAWWDDVRLDR